MDVVKFARVAARIAHECLLYDQVCVQEAVSRVLVDLDVVVLDKSVSVLVPFDGAHAHVFVSHASELNLVINGHCFSLRVGVDFFYNEF